MNNHSFGREHALLERLPVRDFLWYVCAALSNASIFTTTHRRDFFKTRSVIPKIKRAVMRVLCFLLANYNVGKSTAKCPNNAESSGDSPVISATGLDDEEVAAVPTYRLPSGSWVVDKRGLRPNVLPEIVRSDSPVARSQSVDQNSTSDTRLRWSAIRMLARWGTQADLTAVSNEQLVKLLRTSPACRHIIFDRPPDENVELDSFFDLAANEQNGDLRVAVYSWVSRHWPLQDLAEHISRDLLISSDRLDPRRTRLSLRLLKSVIGILPREQARAILQAVVVLATQEVNPYKPGGEQMLARRAVIDILRERPELYETAASFLTTAAMQGRSLSAGKLIAISMRNRAHGAAERLVDLTNRADGSVQTLKILAGNADGGVHRDIRPPTETIRITSFLTRPQLRKFGSVAFIGALTILVGQAASRFGLAVRPAPVPIAVAVATLALLVTAHVFSVNFSGSRLPPEIARHASNSVALDITYSASVMLIIASLLRPKDQVFLVARDWTSAALLAVWILGIIATMLTVFSRTDAVHAADRYYRSSAWRLRKNGRRQGRVQAQALTIEEIIKASPYFSVRINMVPDEWSVPIYSSKRGIVSPSIRSLRSLLSNAEFGEGLQVRLTTGLGTLVETKTLIAVLVPADDQAISDRFASLTEKALMTRTKKNSDMQNAETISLLKVVHDLAESGDVGSASSVARSLSNLTTLSVTSAAFARRRSLRMAALREHARTRHASNNSTRKWIRMRDQRGLKSDDNRIVISAPGLNDVVRIATQYSIDQKTSMFSYTDTILLPLLKSSGSAESFSSLIAFAIPSTEINTDRQRHAQLATLRSAGIRALELRSPAQFGFVFDSVAKLIDADRSNHAGTELLSVLLCFACRYDPGIHATHFKRFCNLLHPDLTNDEKPISELHTVQLLRIGAAAISEGAMTCCVSVALELVKLDITDNRMRLENDASYIRRESTRSNLDGGYLGDTPERCLNEFLAFTKSLGELTAQPDTAVQL